MKNSIGTVIYVGKAKNLKARVSQYFQKKKDNSPKVNEMIEHIYSTLEFDEYNNITLEEKLRNLIMSCFKAFKKDREDCLSQEDIDEAQIIHSYLKNKSNEILV